VLSIRAKFAAADLQITVSSKEMGEAPDFRAYLSLPR
jgi:hypothetical protein